MSDLISRQMAIEQINMLPNVGIKPYVPLEGVLMILYRLPSAQPEFMEIINMLSEEYEKAKEISYVNKPLAYALYQTWKRYDSREVKRDE